MFIDGRELLARDSESRFTLIELAFDGRKLRSEIKHDRSAVDQHGGGRVAVLADPAGAVFLVYELDKKADQ